MKKVLIITYYWPPSGGIGVLRCLKLSKYLRCFGWEPIVYTARDPHYPTIDHSNDKDIPPAMEILKENIWEPYSLYKKLLGIDTKTNVNNVLYLNTKEASMLHKFSIFVRSNFFIPDARACWIKPSVKFLSKYLENNHVDAIVSNGPPHTNTRIATLLKKRTGIPWHADFQDPWTQVDYFSNLQLLLPARMKHEKQEQEVFDFADSISIVSPSWRKDLKAIGASKVHVLPWGFDPSDEENMTDLLDPDSFVISHVGILGPDRDPSNLLKVLEEICYSDSVFRNQLILRFIGQVDRTVEEKVNGFDLRSNVQFIGNVDRSEALNLVSSSDVLLLLLNRQNNQRGRIPGKLFEYLLARRPILCLGKPGDSIDIISECAAVVGCPYDDRDKLKACVLDLYQNSRNKDKLNSQIEQYSVKEISKRLAGILDSIISNSI